MNKKKQVTIGVIGAGRIGQVHAEHLAHRIPGAQLAYISDINTSAAESLAQRLSVPNLIVAKDYHDVLASNVEAVVICSSTDTHSRIIEEAAAAGKHIFCEKPIDHELAKIDRALAAVKKADVKFQVGFNRRFDPNFSHVQQVIASGKIGKPHIVRITSRDPAPPPVAYIKVSGGIFLDMTIHDFDMARFLTGSEVTRVFALGAVMIDPAIGAAGDIDTAVITLEFANGAIATIDNSRQAVYGYDQRIEVFGSEGVISADNNTPHRTTFGDKEGMHAPLPLNFFMDRYTESYIKEMLAFVTAIADDVATPVSGLDGRAPVVIGLAAKMSLHSGMPVLISDVEKHILTAV